MKRDDVEEEQHEVDEAVARPELVGPPEHAAQKPLGAGPRVVCQEADQRTDEGLGKVREGAGNGEDELALLAVVEVGGGVGLGLGVG